MKCNTKKFTYLTVPIFTQSYQKLVLTSWKCPWGNAIVFLWAYMLEAHHMFVSLATLQMEILCIYLRCVIFITFLDKLCVHNIISLSSWWLEITIYVTSVFNFLFYIWCSCILRKNSFHIISLFHLKNLAKVGHNEIYLSSLFCCLVLYIIDWECYMILCGLSNFPNHIISW